MWDTQIDKLDEVDGKSIVFQMMSEDGTHRNVSLIFDEKNIYLTFSESMKYDKLKIRISNKNGSPNICIIDNFTEKLYSQKQKKET